MTLQRQSSPAIVIAHHLSAGGVHPSHYCRAKASIEAVDHVRGDATVGGPGAQLTRNHHRVGGLPALRAVDRGCHLSAGLLLDAKGDRKAHRRCVSDSLLTLQTGLADASQPRLHRNAALEPVGDHHIQLVGQVLRRPGVFTVPVLQRHCRLLLDQEVRQLLDDPEVPGPIDRRQCWPLGDLSRYLMLQPDLRHPR